MKRTLIDLSHTIFDGLTTYKGLPPPHICDYLSREQGCAKYAGQHQVQIGRIDMVANTGTYIDVPFHFAEDGDDLAQVSLQRFADLPGLCLHLPDQEVIDKSDICHLPVTDKALIVHTGWSRHWNTAQYFEDHPFLTASAAKWLVEQRVLLVGIDSHNIDDTKGMLRPVHELLLSHGILIAEHLTNLAQLPEHGFEFCAIPPKIKGMGTFPVRAFARINPVTN